MLVPERVKLFGLSTPLWPKSSRLRTHGALIDGVVRTLPCRRMYDVELEAGAAFPDQFCVVDQLLFAPAPVQTVWAKSDVPATVKMARERGRKAAPRKST